MQYPNEKIYQKKTFVLIFLLRYDTLLCCIVRRRFVDIRLRCSLFTQSFVAIKPPNNQKLQKRCRCFLNVAMGFNSQKIANQSYVAQCLHVNSSNLHSTIQKNSSYFPFLAPYNSQAQWFVI